MKYAICDARVKEPCNHREISEAEAVERMLTGEYRAVNRDGGIFLERKNPES